MNSPAVHPDRTPHRHAPGPMHAISPKPKLTEAAAPLVTLGAATLLCALAPELELACFAQGAARIAGCLAGAPVAPTPEGWAFVSAGRPILVTELCSAVGFFQTLAAVLAWQLTRRGCSLVRCVALGLALALPLTLAVNAARILILAQVHTWIVPLLPERWSGFAHMTTGIAVFLPALIALNLLLEHHARHRAARPV